MNLSNEEKTIVQLKPLDNGASDCFSFKLPAGDLNIKHVEAYIKFLQQNNISELMKALVRIYFTAQNDIHFVLTEEQRMYFENTLLFMTDHTDEKMCKFG